MRFLIVSIIVLVVGCTPEPLDLDVEQAESELVVSTQIIPDRGMIVALTRSFSALSDGTEGSFDEEDLSAYLVENADVSITYDNQTANFIEIGPGLYFSFEVVQSQRTVYDLTVVDNDQSKSISASTKVLAPVPINNGSAKLDYRPTGQTYLNITYDFNDPSEKNFYMFNVYINPRIPIDENGQITTGNNIGGRTGGAPSDDFSGFGNLFSDFSETWLVSDDGMNGQNIQQELTVFDIAVSPDDIIFFTLSNITEEYYNFLQARERSKNTIPFIGEPTTLPTNIEGGYGYFSMHYPFPYFLSIED